MLTEYSNPNVTYPDNKNHYRDVMVNKSSYAGNDKKMFADSVRIKSLTVSLAANYHVKLQKKIKHTITHFAFCCSFSNLANARRS